MKRELHIVHTAEDERSLKSTAGAFERLERQAAEDTLAADAEHPNPSPVHDRKTSDASAATLSADAREERRQRELLQDALAMAQHANHAKSVFLANMSHDFRTPMNAIMSFTDIALDHLDDRNHVEDCLLKIKSSSGHLLTLLNDVLDVSRIESGKLRLNEQPMDLFELGDELTSMFQADVERRELDFALDFSAVRRRYVLGDALRLSQVFINLIGNAVKFTDRGGIVRVEATPCMRLTSNYCRYTFKVADNGCGMSRAFMDHIFEPFERDSIDAVRSTVGTGLGMTITKNLIDMMGGSIEVRSRLGEGSVFTIHIPLKVATERETVGDPVGIGEAEAIAPQTETSAPTATDVAAAKLVGKSVLIVDDDELSREILRELLESRGVVVAEATNGEKAIGAITSSAPGAYDAVLMDLHMPIIDGFEATRRIRALPRKDCATLPIIATTACAFDEDREAASAAGMDGHLSKPLDMKQLYTLLAELTA